MNRSFKDCLVVRGGKETVCWLYEVWKFCCSTVTAAATATWALTLHMSRRASLAHWHRSSRHSSPRSTRPPYDANVLPPTHALVTWVPRRGPVSASTLWRRLRPNDELKAGDRFQSRAEFVADASDLLSIRPVCCRSPTSRRGRVWQISASSRALFSDHQRRRRRDAQSGYISCATRRPRRAAVNGERRMSLPASTPHPTWSSSVKESPLSREVCRKDKVRSKLVRWLPRRRSFVACQQVIHVNRCCCSSAETSTRFRE